MGGNKRMACWSLVLLTGIAAASCGGLAGDSLFPNVKRGVWELSAARTLPDGKVESWNLTVNHCRDESRLFQGYWGLGIVERAGCRYKFSRISADGYKIDSECAVRGVDKAVSEATVVVTGDSAFEMDVTVHEGPRRYRATESGRWVGDCAE